MVELSVDRPAESEEMVSMEELSAFLGKMAHPEEWQAYRDKRSRHAGFNGWAALFGMQWFLFRRLYWQAMVAFAIELGFPLLTLLFITAIAGNEKYSQHQTFVPVTVCLAVLLSRGVNGFWANMALYKKAVKEIRKIDALNFDNELHLKMISSAGSCNAGVLVILYISVLILRVILESTK